MRILRLAGACIAIGMLSFSAPAPALAQEGGGGGDSSKGNLFGDLVHIKRDPATGVPILQKRTVVGEQDATTVEYCPIPVDAYGLEIPFAVDSCDPDPAQLARLVEVDYFGRLSGGRAGERNLRMHFDEMVLRLKGAEVIDRDPAGRISIGTGCTPEGTCTTWAVIDSPFENLGLYYRLLKYGHIQTDPAEVDTDAHGDPEAGTVYHPALGPEDWPKFRASVRDLLPRSAVGECFNGTAFVADCAAQQALTTEDFSLAASSLAGAADKTGKITIDLVQYLNRIISVTKATAASPAAMETLPVLIRDENGTIAPAAPGLPAPADERFLDLTRATYSREARFSQTFTALVSTGDTTWQTTPGVSVLDFLRFMNGASAPLEQAPAFVANAHDALRTVEFIHNYEPPADLRARGAFTTTSVMDRTISTSAAAQAVPLLATITDQQTVNGGTVEFTVLQSNGTLVGVAASGPVTNGIGTADYVIPAATPAGSYIILAAYSGATGFAASRGTGTLTISATPVDPCTAVILPTTAIAPAEGGTASVVVTIAPGCAWTAVPSDSWIVPAVTSGTGTATIEYETSRNTSGAARVGSLTIAGQILEITQPPMVALRSDFNGDGSPDLIFQHADGRVVVWFMDGITQIGSATLASPTDPNWRVAGVADFNTDGAADLLWQHRTTGALSIWLMKGTTMQSAVAVPEQPSDPLWKVVGLDDVNHDGYTDLIWQHQTTRMVLLWLMNGYVRQSATTIVATVGEGWRIAAVAHVDGDEHVDLVWQNTTTGAISLWTLVAGVVKDGRAFDAPIVTDPSWKLVSAADLNGDGNVDLVWQHVDGRVVVWYMNGATFESSAQIAPAGDDPAWRLVVVR